VVHTHLPEATDLVDVDRRRIEQVLTNILDNAFRFTPKGGRIDIYLTEPAAGVQVCIQDSGPGIPSRDLPRVFDRFYVVDDGRGLSGVGLGLFIAQQMIELHGGRIWAESQPGRGSQFCFTLPAATHEVHS